MTNSSDRGFTLVEALVSLFLIGVSLLAAAPLFLHATRASTVDADMGYVSARAVQQMELLDGAAYGALFQGGGLDTNVAGYFNNSDPRVLVRWQIVDAPGSVKTLHVRAIATRRVVGPAKQVILESVRAR